MPIPLAVGRWNRIGFNRLSTPVARHLPGFGVVHHRGRRSGREYRTPVNVFPVPGGLVIALTYGPHTDWVRNVLAASACTVETRGRLLACHSPRILRDPGRSRTGFVARAALGALGVDEFLELLTD